MHSHEVRYELDMLYQKTKYPNSHQVSHVSIITGLTRQQVLNYFKNKRSRSPGYKASSNVDLMASTKKPDLMETDDSHPPDSLCPTQTAQNNPDSDNSICQTDLESSINLTDLSINQTDCSISCTDMDTDMPHTDLSECSSSNLETVISNVKLSCLSHSASTTSSPQPESLQ